MTESCSENHQVNNCDKWRCDARASNGDFEISDALLPGYAT